MGRGGVKTFDALVDAVGDNSSVDGTAQAPVITARSGLSRAVPLRDLIGNPNNPRDSVGDLEELASIVEFQLQPVVVVPPGVRFRNIYSRGQDFGPVGGHHRQPAVGGRAEVWSA